MHIRLVGDVGNWEGEGIQSELVEDVERCGKQMESELGRIGGMGRRGDEE